LDSTTTGCCGRVSSAMMDSGRSSWSRTIGGRSNLKKEGRIDVKV
jgi:hypothetical protein